MAGWRTAQPDRRRHHGRRTGRDQIALRLPLYLSVYLDWRRRFDDWLTVLAISRDTARRLGDQANEAAALTNPGLALREVRRFDEAITAHQDAAAIFRETGDRHGEGMALGNLGLALGEVRRFDEADHRPPGRPPRSSGRPATGTARAWR